MRSGKEARPVETPAVVWAGDEPVGQLESDPWVRTLRDAFLALAAATNTVDFTDGALSATWREDIVQRAATLARSQLDTDNAYVVLGPRPFTPVEVNVEAGEVSAEVAVCIEQSLMIEQTPSEERTGVEARINGLSVGEDGRRRITGSRQPEDGHTLASGDLFTDAF